MPWHLYFPCFGAGGGTTSVSTAPADTFFSSCLLFKRALVFLCFTETKKTTPFCSKKSPFFFFVFIFVFSKKPKANTVKYFRNYAQKLRVFKKFLSFLESKIKEKTGWETTQFCLQKVVVDGKKHLGC